MKKIVTAVFIILTLVLLCMMQQKVYALSDDFIITYWTGPRPSMDHSITYADVDSCNFSYTFQPVEGSDNIEILSQSASRGLKYIVCDERTLVGTLISSGYSPDTQALYNQLDSAISEYGNNPGTGGYYLIDQPTSAEYAMTQSVTSYLKSNDPAHLTAFSLGPNYGGSYGYADYTAYVDAFAALQPGIMFFDNFPLPSTGVRSDYYANHEIIRSKGLQYNIRTGVTIQMIDYGGLYTNPSESQIRWQVYTSLAYGCTGIMYYSYWMHPSYGNGGCVAYDGTRNTSNWNLVQALNNEINYLAPYLMDCKSDSVYHIGTVPAGCSGPPPGLLANVTSYTYDMIQGMYTSSNGTKYMILVNKDTSNNNSCTLTLDSSVTKVECLNATDGGFSELSISNNQVMVGLAPGQGYLFRIQIQPPRDFIITYWQGPRPGWDPNYRYSEVADCNFTWTFQPSEWVDGLQDIILNQSYINGMKYLVPDPYNLLVRSLIDKGFAPDSQQLYDYIDPWIDYYASHNGAGGFFLIDEPLYSEEAMAKSVNARMKARAPNLLTCVNLNPIHGGTQGYASYEAYVEAWMDNVGTDIVTFDHYPLLADGTDRSDYFANFEVIREKALDHERRYGLICQVFTWDGSLRNPTESEIRYQVYSAVAYGCSFIMYFNYQGGPNTIDDGCLDWDTGAKRLHWYELQLINNELKHLGPTLMQLTSTGVYHLVDVPSDCIAPPSSGLPVTISATRKSILGMFSNNTDGKTYMVVTNKDYSNNTSYTMTFDQSITSVDMMIPSTGEWVPVTLNDNVASLVFPPGQGYLFRLNI